MIGDDEQVVLFSVHHSYRHELMSRAAYATVAMKWCGDVKYNQTLCRAG